MTMNLKFKVKKTRHHFVVSYIAVVHGKQHKYRNISQLEWDNSTM